jgi:hypothetical protein
MIDSLKRLGNPAIVLVELWSFVNNYLCTLSQRLFPPRMYSLSQTTLTPGHEAGREEAPVFGNMDHAAGL